MQQRDDSDTSDCHHHGVAERIVTPKPLPDPVRVRRLRDDARRSLSANLAEGIALSHALLRFTGVARRG